MTTFKNQGIVIHEDISDVGISLTKDISLESLQAAVGGYIENIQQHRFPDVILYANEDGQQKNLPPNTAATIIFERPLVGNVVMVAYKDEMIKELDFNDDDVLSPLDDMMDRHRSRLEKGKLRTWEGEPGDPDDENNMLSVDNPMRYK
jgi:hypothetical protein